MQAFNWAGFDDGTTFLGGLHINRTTSTSDFATVAYRAQLLGFNAVRIPFRSAYHSFCCLPGSNIKCQQIPVRLRVSDRAVQ